MLPKTKGNEKVGVYVPLGGSKNPIAYCNYHKATLSKAQMDAKECLNRKCYHLQKFENDYWKKRKKLKASGKAKRQFAREENEEMMETRIVTKDEKQKALERGNVFVGETRATKPALHIDPTNYDEQDVKVRAERAYTPKPLTKETFKALSFEERKKWLLAMQAKFPNVGQAKYEAAMGFGRNAMQHIFEKCQIKRTHKKVVPEGEQVMWDRFWGVDEKPKEVKESVVEAVKETIKEAVIAENKETNVKEEPRVPFARYFRVGISGTLRGKAKDIWEVLKMLGMTDSEIEVTI